ncbi:amino acid adenylation domain-containing protein [Paenibacillus sp. 1011MAR3C5]|uniref:non-ribosomal peptide synthetase n=1 Tax=Paenibacillus sp. 1011MAR3C5 TaxID=1675787 RepID=UPI000E6BB329|nr:non-ribosomal peptide synthetase [Paenibacillus sp. 1011MAR3C5]RJE89650.1 amino acid adenylation domain-containing protein [Paenibacillus sp. 1011MAR3C5]
MSLPPDVTPNVYDSLPLSHPQKRIWYLEKIFPDTSLSNIGGPVRIKGEVDFRLLEKAIGQFIASHEGIRLQLDENNGEARQYVADYIYRPLECFDFSLEPDPEASFWDWVNKEAGTPFKLEHSPLYYFALFRINGDDCGYLFKCHHIICDGWSTQIMTSQISHHYTLLAEGRRAEDAEQPPSYLLYLNDEQSYLASKRFGKNKHYWSEKFSKLPDGLAVTDSFLTDGRRTTIELDQQLSSRIREAANQAGVSLNTFFILVYFTYRYKRTHQNDLVVGTPVLNRSGKREKAMFGMFTSTMPFRFILNPDASVEESLVLLQRELMENYFHQRYPYDLLVRDLELKKKGYDQLFHACVNYYNTRLITSMNGSPVDNVEFYNGQQAYELQWVIKDWSDTGALTLDLDYRTDVYSEQQIHDMAESLLALIDGMLASPRASIGSLSLLSGQERQRQITELNDTAAEYPSDKSVRQLFEEQVRLTPDRIATWHDGGALTYRELNEAANRLAHRLIRDGIGKETTVAIWTHHSAETVIAIWGVLKTGAAYVPIDPAYPEERIRYMLEDSGAKLVLTNIDGTEGHYPVPLLDLRSAASFDENGDNPEIRSEPSDLAYIIYTSGSTGQPKGAMIEHRGLTNYIWWAKLMYAKEDPAVFPLYSSLAFDLTVTSIFTPLICGGQIRVYRDTGDEFILYRILRDNRSTVVKLTPAHLSLLQHIDYRHSSVRRFIVGGEDLKTSLARNIYDHWGGHIDILNEYGPTETVVGCMIHRFDPNEDTRASVPIGIPAHNVMIYLLDPYLNPVPEGTLGEMYISGDGVARGYRNRIDLTNERFVDNPFLPGKRMYRTGDLAKRLRNGKIEYAGRTDHQVKIRGHRIELAEIEKTLLQDARVRDAVVIDREHADQSKYLCAYIVSAGHLDRAELRQSLSAQLPSYMVPSYFVAMDEIPLSVNGKVDRKLLPEPEASSNSYTPFQEGRNDAEHILLLVLSELLGISPIGIRDNFYHLGGDSIKAIQASSRLNGLGYGIQVKEILGSPVIEDMASLLRPLSEGMRYPQTPAEGSIRHWPIASWFLRQNFQERDHYHQSVLLAFKQDATIPELEQVLQKLIEHHDSLRIGLESDRDTFVYVNDPAYRVQVHSHSLTDCSDEEQADCMSRIGEALKGAFDLREGRLLQASLFDLGRNGKRLLLAAHHLAVDGVSWRILLEDLAAGLQQLRTGKPVTFQDKTASVQAWGEQVHQYRLPDEERSYWRSVASGLRTIPADIEDGRDDMESARTVVFELSEEETGRLLRDAHAAYGTKPLDVLIAALGQSLFDQFSLDQVGIEMEGHGREPLGDSIDLTRTAGWFTSLYPLRLMETKNGLPSWMKAVKEQLRQVPGNGIGFGLLHQRGDIPVEYAADKLVRFNFMGDFDSEFRNEWFDLADEASGAESGRRNALTALLDIHAIVVRRKLRVSATYSASRFLSSTVESWMQVFKNRLAAIIAHCCEKDAAEYTPSDFDTIKLSQDELDSLLM